MVPVVSWDLYKIF